MPTIEPASSLGRHARSCLSASALAFASDGSSGGKKTGSISCSSKATKTDSETAIERRMGETRRCSFSSGAAGRWFDSMVRWSWMSCSTQCFGW